MQYLGIDIGGTRVKTVLLDKDMQILKKDEVATHDGVGDWKTKILGLIKKEAGASERQALTIGISAPGLADAGNRKILHMPERLQGIENFDWGNAADREIWVVNDGHAACLAEYHSYQKEKNIKNMLLLTLGTGVGGGVIVDGRLYQGNLNRAGHFGHMTVDHDGAPTMTNMLGSLEYAIGNFSVGQRTQGHYSSTKELVKAYEENEVTATFWWLESVKKLALALASLVNTFSPEVVVLGGGISSGAKDSLIKPLHEFMALYEWQPGGYRTAIELAQFGQYAGAMGAALFAKSKS
ncbi:ROK family protein [Flagellimonas lutaonensis]|uniref:Glucokinase n=1 Tax=Flagellimonas lutaonensis TaxID=516051 RepID=A0A0D5YUM0_9FLAO|nr:ROK family protein [Allomuricauda lutaonensis]AKA35586.1 Glucokinase [Allomuricauda lutaonensis]